MRIKTTALIAGLMLLAASSAFAASYSVSVGYADSLRASGFFPNPWCGSANIVCIGQTGGAALDSGAIRIVNTSGATITVNDVSYKQANGTTYDLWGSNTLGVGQSLVLFQTSQYNFDSSDTNDFMPAPDNPLALNQIGGCNDLSVYNASTITADNLTTACANNVGQVTVTINGVATTFNDSGFVLNTGGYDFVNYSKDGNESIDWTTIGTITNRGGNTTPEPATLALMGTGLLGIAARLRRLKK